jgi:hypothetical protein
MKTIDCYAHATLQLLQLSPPDPHSVVLPSLPFFLAQIAQDSQVGAAVLYVGIYYIHQLKSRLSPHAVGMFCTAHRIALASLILAEKYICDIALKNRSWATHAKYFSLREINLMERQLLQLLVFCFD